MSKGSNTLELDFERLYQSYYPWIRSIAFRMVGPKDFQDIAQEAFLKAWKSRDAFRFRSSSKTWIYRIAVNCIVDHLRKTAREQTWLTSQDVETIPNNVEDSIVESSMQNLELNDRLILNLHYFEDLSIQEISSVLKIAAGTVKSRLFVAREKVRKTVLRNSGDKIYGR